jgi:hypothetical protein
MADEIETQSPATVQGLIEQLRAGAVSRRQFFTALSGMGLTATGAATVFAVARRLRPGIGAW